MISNLSAAAALGLALIGVPAGSALAAQPADRSPTRVAEASPVRPVAATESEDKSANCSKPRRRLWVEGEGWIVRRVTICR